MSKHAWLFSLAIACLAVKASVLLLDPDPAYFMGDSGAFVRAMTSDFIPVARSFTYGGFFKPLVTAFGSMEPVVVVQSLLGVLTALTVAVIAHDHFGVGRGASATVGLLCALDPTQLAWERFVLCDTAAAAFFTLQLAFGLTYARRGGLVWLAATHAAGLAAVSLRIAYLPLVLAAAILPVLRFRGSGWRRTVLHLLVSVALVGAGHGAFREATGRLLNTPAAYNNQGGFWLLGYFLPLVEPADFPRPELYEAVVGQAAFDHRDPATRIHQRWDTGGAIQRLRTAIPNWLEANAQARSIAVNAVLRNPLGVLELASFNLRGYFNGAVLEPAMREDLGLEPPLPAWLIETLAAHFGPGTAERAVPTLTPTRRLALASVPWLWFVLASPILWGLLVVRRLGEGWASVQPALCCAGAALFFIVSSLVLAERPIFRYLLPPGILCFPLIALLLQGAVAHVQARLAPGARITP